ncbi:MAG TPA: hypothetical protein VFP41_10700 [Actinomycetota bacterium]|nr:hypothetical protein [Actinomycetota bacterium]
MNGIITGSWHLFMPAPIAADRLADQSVPMGGRIVVPLALYVVSR